MARNQGHVDLATATGVAATWAAAGVSSGVSDEASTTVTLVGVAATLGSGSDDGASTLGLASAAGVVTPVCKIRIYEIQERYSGR